MKTYRIELENGFEADVFSGLLQEEDIPHTVVPHYSLAYDGLFQLSMGWGHVELPEEYKERAIEIYKEYRAMEG